MKRPFKTFLKKKVTDPLISFLQQGLKPEMLSRTIASGLLIGTIPIPGTSTLLCTALSLGFRMNLALIQLVNYLVFPLQILLFVPFYTIASKISGKIIFLNASEITAQFIGSNWQKASIDLLWLAGTSVLVWLLIMFPVSLMLYFILKPVMKRFARKEKSEGQSAEGKGEGANLAS